MKGHPPVFAYNTPSPTLPETNTLHLKIGHPKRKLVFQPSIFRCENVSFREGKTPSSGKSSYKVSRLSENTSIPGENSHQARGGNWPLDFVDWIDYVDLVN